MTLTVAFLILLVGLVLYVLPTNPKVNELGRLMFFAGLLVALMAMGGKAVSF
jgi:Na+/phosphate symporter